MGHKQPPTPLQTENAMAEAVSNSKIQPKRTKAMDMRFHWLRNKECQTIFAFIGDQENSIMLTTGPSITLHCITKM